MDLKTGAKAVGCFEADAIELGEGELDRNNMKMRESAEEQGVLVQNTGL